MENIFEKTIKWYRNYLNLTKKQKKLNVVRRTIEILKEQLGNDVDNVTIRWLPEKGEAMGIINIWSNSKISDLVREIWKYLFSDYNIENINITITTYDLANEISRNTNETAQLIFQTDILTEKCNRGYYSNYILLTRYTDDDITVYIYLGVEDKCDEYDEDDC